MSEHAAEKGAGRFVDTFEADHAESMKDPEYAAAYRAAEERQDRLIEQTCSEGNCVEFIDPDTGENTGGWGPVGCPCQDTDNSGTPPAVRTCGCGPDDPPCQAAPNRAGGHLYGDGIARAIVTPRGRA